MPMFAHLALIAVFLVLAGKVQAADFFDDPVNLCNALTEEGFKVRQWKYSEMGEYNCLTPYITIAQPEGYGLPNNIAYYVVGNEEQKADLAQVVLNVNDDGTRSQAIDRFKESAKSLFSAVNAPMPKKISSALEKPKVGNNPTEIVAPTDFGKAILTFRQNGKVDEFKLLLLREGATGSGYVPKHLR
jgi:UTP-glucose-1-phosphate uridylyltransferase